MSKEIIEFLKTNRVPYYLWTPEERAVADKILRRWWLYYSTASSIFIGIEQTHATLGGENNLIGVYRLKPDYQDEPESMWVEWPVEYLKDNRNNIRFMAVDPKGNYDAIYVSHLPDAEGFGGIMYEDCECESMADAGMTGKFHTAPPEPCEKHGPHKPLKVRFWRGK